MNDTIITEFNKLLNVIKIEFDNSKKKDRNTHLFRIRSIEKIIKIFKGFDKDITVNNIKDIRGIGKGTVDRVEEILNTGELSEVKGMSNKEEETKNTYVDLVNQKEQALTEEEKNIDFGNMKALDLGEDTKYKTKLVQNRWEQHRSLWL